MLVYDENGNIVENPDLELGRLKADKRFIAHHEAVEAVKEQSHYEIVMVYPNGGKDVQKVIDVPAVEAQEAWDEYEEIYRYISYTESEIEAIEFQRNNSATGKRIAELEAALDILLTGVTE